MKKTTSNKSKTGKKTPSFEKSLSDLETIVKRMEEGEQSLEDSLKDFETGMALAEQCQDELKNAELRVEKLIKKRNGDVVEPFDLEE